MTEHSKEVTRTETKRWRECDCCGYKSNRLCFACGRDICLSCTFEWWTDPWTGEGDGLVSTLTCKDCYDTARASWQGELSKSLRRKINETEMKLMSVRDEWLRSRRRTAK